MEILLMEGGLWDSLVCQGGLRYIFSYFIMLIEEILDFFLIFDLYMFENVINVVILEYVYSNNGF